MSHTIRIEVGERAPSPSGAAELLIANGDYCSIIYVAASTYSPSMATFDGMVQVRFGSPQEDEQEVDPVFAGLLFGFYEVIDSSWIAELESRARRANPRWFGGYSAKHHYIGCFKGSIIEVVAESIAISSADDYNAMAAAAMTSMLQRM